MAFLLDTNAVIAFQKSNSQLQAFIRRTDTDIFISSIILHELYFGAFKSSKVAMNLANIGKLPFEQFDFDEEDARVAGEIRAVLKAQGNPIGPYDTLIAGQALARDLTVVTRNKREFERVEGLRVENWEG